MTKNDIQPYYYVRFDGTVLNKRTLHSLVGKIDRYGYRVMCLSLTGGVKHVPVHRLVALWYLPNPDNLPQINHKDGNKHNNNVSNLEWCSAQHNSRHAYDNGLSKAWNKGKKDIYTPDQILKIKDSQPHKRAISVSKDGEIVAKYDSIRELCRQMNFDRRTAMRVLKGEVAFYTIKGYKLNYS